MQFTGLQAGFITEKTAGDSSRGHRETAEGFAIRDNPARNAEFLKFGMIERRDAETQRSGRGLRQKRKNILKTFASS